MTSTEQASRPVDILLVEDSEADVLLMREGFARSGIDADLSDVENGEECMAFLRRQGRYAEAPTPDLILLDLNMPIMGGREVLEEIVADDELKHLPVVVLTTSGDPRSILEMYRLRCNSYIQKPVDFTTFDDLIAGLGRYWLNLVTLPAA